MNKAPREIRTAADADAIREEIEGVYDGWFANEPHIDWDEFLDRLERDPNIDLGDSMETPAIRRIKAIVKELRADQ